MADRHGSGSMPQDWRDSGRPQAGAPPGASTTQLQHTQISAATPAAAVTTPSVIGALLTPSEAIGLPTAYCPIDLATWTEAIIRCIRHW